ncbi:MAG: bifunctional adenosylcobinamide kinase/adenosylcobinamide-phosphate guanylyltransferase [Candidatus Omnitrophota bacterium]|nr:bifunctional adenosylcobinamide kinase/adenosylcobinamide-phosphate guanylyltransferase [Candidatus Omnitrophota bacterium]
MGKITFILGGARSGKSSFAINLAKKYKRVCFIATCQPKDAEMKRRIGLHKKNRPKEWQTIEEYKNIEKAITKVDPHTQCLIIDCLTLFISNLFLAKGKEKVIEEKIKQLLKVLKKVKARVIIVSNEVGLGVVPASKLGRDFRDIAGRVNQIVAIQADKVVFMVSGLPLIIRDSDYFSTPLE